MWPLARLPKCSLASTWAVSLPSDRPTSRYRRSPRIAEPKTTTKTLTITREELQAFLERGQFSFRGNAATGGVVTLDTDQEIRVRITVDVSLVTEPEGT